MVKIGRSYNVGGTYSIAGVLALMYYVGHWCRVVKMRLLKVCGKGIYGLLILIHWSYGDCSAITRDC